MPRNYQRLMEEQVAALPTDRVPRLLLHSCCAPCSSYVLETLANVFAITVLYDNPNIAPKAEFDYRAQEQARLIAALPTRHPVNLVVADYRPEAFSAVAKGLEREPEGGARCEKCYRLRMEHAAAMAKQEGYDYFTTTLSISPLKKAETLNRIGEALSAQYGVPYLYADFKKKNGYLRSCELSREYGLYRQDYCGCIYSRREKE